MGGGSDNTELPAGFIKFISDIQMFMFQEIMLLLNLLEFQIILLLIGALDIQTILLILLE